MGQALRIERDATITTGESGRMVFLEKRKPVFHPEGPETRRKS